MHNFPIVAVLETKCGATQEMRWPEFTEIIRIPLRVRTTFTDGPEVVFDRIPDNTRTFRYRSKNLPYVYYEEV